MIEMIQGNCMDYMAKCKDNEFDLAITSPPYNMNLRVNQKLDGYCSRQICKEISTKYNNFNDNLTMDEYEYFLDQVISELIRVSKLTFFNIQMITGNKPALFKIIGKYSSYIKELIIWDKGKGQPAIANNVLNSSFELILIFSKNSITRAFDECNFSRGTLDNIWRIDKEKSTDSTHKAVFPKLLIEKILYNFSKHGDKVIDPFMGTGTTAICAHNLKCDFLGIELDQEYYDLACERFKRETAQTTLF